MADVGKVTIPEIMGRKGRGPKIVQVTCYDFPTAVVLGRAGVDIAMVGDSLAQVALGSAPSSSPTCRSSPTSLRWRRR